MAAPDPEGIGLLAKIIAAGSAVAAPIGWLYTKLDKKADKHAVNNQIQEVKAEQALHRGYFKDVFEKIEDHSQKSEQRHRELMMHLLERK